MGVGTDQFQGRNVRAPWQFGLRAGGVIVRISKLSPRDRHNSDPYKCIDFFNSHGNCKGRFYYCPQFLSKETEAQRDGDLPEIA